MGWFKKTFHPNRVKRELERKAEENRNIINQQAAQQREAARIRKEKDIQAIDAACNNAKIEIENWHQLEMSKANENYTTTQNSYFENLDDLKVSFDQQYEAIENGFNSQREILLLNQRDDEDSVTQCYKRVTLLSAETEDYYSHHKFVLDRLWREVESEMLHKQYHKAYVNLKSDIKTDYSKIKFYSLLVSYLRHLSEKYLISARDVERYTKFIYALYSSNGSCEQDSSFNSVDCEIMNLFEHAEINDNRIASNAHKKDAKIFSKKYSQAKDFDNELLAKVAAATDDINLRYDVALRKLTDERDENNYLLQSRYKEVIKDIEEQKNNYQAEYDSYVNSLRSHKDEKNNEINTLKNKEIAKVNAKIKMSILNINKNINESLKKISDPLAEQLKHVSNVYKATITNICLTVESKIIASFPGGLLSGVSVSIVKIVKSSLLITNLSSAENFANDDGKVIFMAREGLSHGHLSRPPSSGFSHSNPRFINSSPENTHMNLATLQNRFRKVNGDVQYWQSQTEHNLFYSLNREISSPQLTTSDALTFNLAQGANRAQMDSHASLGVLGAYGCRSVAWDINLNNQGRWFGSDILRSRDVKNIIQRLAGVSNDALGHNEHVIHFTKNSKNQNVISNTKYRAITENNSFEIPPSMRSSIREEAQVDYSVKQFVSKTENRYASSTQKSTLGKIHDVRSPLTFKFESGKFNSCVPIASIKIRNSVVSNSAVNNGLYGREGLVNAENYGVEASNVSVNSFLNKFNLAVDPKIKDPTPIEIHYGYAELTYRQSKLISELSKPGKSITINKSEVNVMDLAVLTAKTGDEFAMFTLSGRRIVFRGNKYDTTLDANIYNKLKKESWILSAHTHPGTSNLTLLASGGDRNVLVYMNQEQSIILNSSVSGSVLNYDGISMAVSNNVSKLGVTSQ